MTFAQHEIKVDSITYYYEQIQRIHREQQQALRENQEYRSASENLTRLKAQTDNYGGFVLYTQAATANFKKLNADITSQGFPALKGEVWGIGYGGSFKKNRRIFDFNVSVWGINKKSKKDSEKVKVSSSSAFEFVWGYDFLKSNRINFYPYAGLGLRFSSLEYQAKAELNTAPSSILNIVIHDRSVSDEVTEFGYQAGLGLEFVLTKPGLSGGIILFTKAGTNRAFSPKKFDLEGYKFDADFQFGNMVYAAGFKFFSRR